MKLFKYAALLALTLVADNAYAATWSMLMPNPAAQYCAKSGNCYTPASSGLVTGVASSDASSLEAQGGVILNQNAATQGVAFSATTTGNPLMLVTAQDISVASVNTTGGYAFLPGVTGRTIYPLGLTLMASGTAASNAGIEILCSSAGSGRVIASIPRANFVDKISITPFSSTAGTTTYASDGLARGCASGDSVYVSNMGANLTTTTDLFINMPYTIQ